MINTEPRNQIKEMFARMAMTKNMGRHGRINTIRHTNDVIGYDKKTNHYNEWENGRDGRAKLNFCISCLDSGIINEDTFYSMVKDIDKKINLNKKSNQKQYIQQKIAEFQGRFPYMAKSQIKKMAINELNDLLENQKNKNEKHFSTKNKVYVID